MTGNKWFDTNGDLIVNIVAMYYTLEYAKHTKKQLLCDDNTDTRHYNYEI